MKLVVVEEGARTALEFDKPEIKIGRAIDNDIRLAGAHASRHHCRIVQEDNGYVLVSFRGYVIEMSVPVLAALVAVPGKIDQQAAMAFFLIGAVPALLADAGHVLTDAAGLAVDAAVDRRWWNSFRGRDCRDRAPCTLLRAAARAARAGLHTPAAWCAGRDRNGTRTHRFRRPPRRPATCARCGRTSRPAGR